MGEPFVGIVHPCKVYNIMSLGIPVLYVGPECSHITDLTNYKLFSAQHGDVAGAIAQIEKARGCERRPLNAFSKHILLPQLIEHLEVEPKSEAYSFAREVTLS
jgi:colanic acid biosynthesis glycosyl transferase WcaI